MAKVLLLGSGTQAYAILKPLHDHGHNIIMLTNSNINYGDQSRFVGEVVRMDFALNSFEYLRIVKELILSRGIEVIIPMGDATAEFLSKNKNDLQKICKFKIPDYNCFIKGYDKNNLMSLCKIKSYPHPNTIDLSSVNIDDLDIDRFPYPAILKPNCTTGGRGMVVVSNADQLRRVFPQISEQYGNCHLQRFIRSGGRQFKVQLYVSEKGELLAHSVLNKVRWYPIKGGSSCCAVTVENDYLVSVCYKILIDINWIGFADFDIIEDPDSKELLIMEINPRLPACVGASVYSGINWAQIIVDDSLGNTVKEYKGKQGVILRHLALDTLWFIKSNKRFKTKPSWFHFFGSNVFYQDFHFADQKPFWSGTWQNLKKMHRKDYKQHKTMDING